MGFILFQSYNEKDTPIIEEIAKLHKVDVKMKGGDKLCAYLYTIVLGKKEEDDD